MDSIHSPRDRGNMPFLLGLVFTPVGAAAGTLTMILLNLDSGSLWFRIELLPFGTMAGSVLMAPITIIVLPFADLAIRGTRYDAWTVHAGLGFWAGGLWMLGLCVWIGVDARYTRLTLELCLAGAVCGAICGHALWWILKRPHGPWAEAGSPAPPAHS
jgi:hypothetical protein